MDYQEACIKSDWNIAVRINNVGTHVYRNSDTAWIYDADFRKIIVDKNKVDGFHDWEPQ